MELPSCMKCSSRMERGFVLDQARNHDVASQWVEGAPERALLSGVKTRGKARLVIETFRCARCGYLESYALPAESP